MTGAPSPCPLCGGVDVGFFCADAARVYLWCRACDLVFVDPAALPAPEAERARYETHNNHVDDPGYAAFLERFAAPFCEALGPAPQEGLDYGCGPGPALASLLEARGHRVAVWDPFFTVDDSVLTRTYDFVTCTEVVEHFHRPGEEFARLVGLLRPGGRLGVMTALRPADEAFPTWHYRRDFTHVSFFSQETFEFLARRFGLTVSFPARDLVFFRVLSCSQGSRATLASIFPHHVSPL